MIKKIYLGLLVIVILVSVALVIQLGLKPRSISKISLSQFRSDEDLGINTYKRLRFEIKEKDLLVLGYLPEREESIKSWLGLFNEMDLDGVFTHNIYIDETFKDSLPFDQLTRFNSSGDLKALVDEINETRKQKQRWVVLVPSPASTHLVPDNFIHQLEQKLKEPVLSLTLIPLLNQPDEESSSPVPCVESMEQSERPYLGCVIRNTSRLNYRKIKNPKDFYGILEQYGLFDYLLFTNHYR